MSMTEAELARVQATGIKGVRGTFPLPVPNGWFGVAESDELAPAEGRIPERARVRAFPTTEMNGLILAWHHLLDKPPAWELPELPEFSDPDWVGPVLHEPLHQYEPARRDGE
jgi:hypothetical protein